MGDRWLKVGINTVSLALALVFIVGCVMSAAVEQWRMTGRKRDSCRCLNTESGEEERSRMKGLSRGANDRLLFLATYPSRGIVREEGQQTTLL